MVNCGAFVWSGVVGKGVGRQKSQKVQSFLCQGHCHPPFRPMTLADPLDKLEEILVNASGAHSLPLRFRALFALRNIKTDRAVEIIGKAFSDPSALLKHELAYVLGQMRNASAIPVLNAVLADTTQDPMVRHEAAEALGAIGELESIPILKAFLTDPAKPVSETCEIAIDNIMKHHHGEDKNSTSEGVVFGSVDPAPPVKERKLVPELRNQLLNTSLPLYDRYKAMFALRNKATEEAVLALCDGLSDSSALFRHEIGYVLGQLQHPASISALGRVLANDDEVGMVRHECAEALGSIATEECMQILARYRDDPEPVVRESCIVALDMGEYEQNGEFELIKV